MPENKSSYQSEQKRDEEDIALSQTVTEDTENNTAHGDQPRSDSHVCDEPSSQSNKSHLTSSVPRVAKLPSGALTKGEMAEIREIFGDMDDTEIQRLYKKVTK